MKPLCWLACASLAASVLANTEKTIFSGPPTVNIPTKPPTLDSLGLDVLAPDVPAIRTKVDASFPSDIMPQGTATWLLLYNLTTAQRYELRVCWAATQPTGFVLDTYEVDHVFETPELITSLAVYAQKRQLAEADGDIEATSAMRLLPPAESDMQSSVLFLRILAAADYYSDNPERMAKVEPVLVDIILDPYIYNVLPHSLAPTAAYIVAVAILAWYVSQHIRRWIQGASPPASDAKKTN